MRFRSMMLAVGLVFGVCGAAAQPGERHWDEAQSLRELPVGVQVLLGVGLAPADGGIADRYQPYNFGDAIRRDEPRRHFAFGLVDGDTALVAVDLGGRASSVQAVEFRRTGVTWEPVRCAVRVGRRETPKALLMAFAAHVDADNTACQALMPPPGA